MVLTFGYEDCYIKFDGVAIEPVNTMCYNPLTMINVDKTMFGLNYFIIDLSIVRSFETEALQADY